MTHLQPHTVVVFTWHQHSQILSSLQSTSLSVLMCFREHCALHNTLLTNLLSGVLFFWCLWLHPPLRVCIFLCLPIRQSICTIQFLFFLSFIEGRHLSSTEVGGAQQCNVMRNKLLLHWNLSQGPRLFPCSSQGRGYPAEG